MQCTVNKLHSKQTIPTNRKKQKQLRCINLTIKHCTDERQIVVCSGGNVLDLKLHYRPKTKKWQEKKTKRMWEEGRANETSQVNLCVSSRLFCELSPVLYLIYLSAILGRLLGRDEASLGRRTFTRIFMFYLGSTAPLFLSCCWIL